MKIELNKVQENKALKQQKQSLIAAVVHVSESEVIQVLPEYAASLETENKPKLEQVLFDLGLNVNQDYIRQDGIQHRNRLGQIVTCSRWYGSERNDVEWLNSGYASQAAVDRNKNNRLLDDSYRVRHLTTDAQYTLEQRDRNDPVID